MIGAVVCFLSSHLYHYLQVTQYRNTLDEWSNGHPSTVKLERKLYKAVYDEILRAMAAVEDDRIDGPRLRERLTAWVSGHSNPSYQACTSVPNTSKSNLPLPVGCPYSRRSSRST